MRSLIAIGAALGVAIFAGAPAEAAQRLALVIGNDAYRNVAPLQKAVADARAYRNHFENEREFDQVFYAEDADEEQMTNVIAQFLGSIDPGDTVVVVYSGHGVQLDQNRSDSLFLLPTDIPELDSAGLGSEFKLSRNAISFTELRDQISLRGASKRVFVLDACRDNPFASADGTRSVGLTRGLAPIRTVSGEFVLFAAAPGERALDRLSDSDPSPNSVFSRVFLRHFRRGAFLEDIANEVQSEVYQLALTASPAFVQQPYYDDGVIGKACIDEECGVTQPPVSTGTTPIPNGGTDGDAGTRTATAPQASRCSPELARELWDLARSSNDCLGYQAYLETCPDSTFAAFARAGAARLQCEDPGAVVAAATPPPAPQAQPAAPGAADTTEDYASIQAGGAATPPLADEERRESAGDGGADATPVALAPLTRYEARREVLSTLAELYRAGFETRYDTLSVNETDEGVTARLEGVFARAPELDFAIELEAVDATLSPDGVVFFQLPDRIVLEELETGEGQEPERMLVLSEALQAAFRRDEEDGQVMKLSADLLRLRPPAEDGNDSITFNRVEFDARLFADPIRNDASLNADVKIGGAVFDFNESEQVELNSGGMLFRFDADTEQAKGALGIERIEFNGRDFGTMQFRNLAFTLDAAPQDRFDLASVVAPGAATEAMLEAFAASVYFGVLSGGRIDTTAQLGSLNGFFTDERSTFQADIDASNLAYRVQLNPNRVGTSIEAENFDVDVRADEDVKYAFDGLLFDFAAEPGGEFNFSSVAAATNENVAMQALFDHLRSEIVNGGRASLAMTSNSYEAAIPVSDPSMPFKLLVTKSGANATEIGLERDTATLAMKGDDIVYQTLGALTGEASIGLFAVDADFPLAASPAEQSGRLGIDLADVTLSDSYWSLLDPNGALPHEIGGLSLQSMVVATIGEDLVSLDPSRFADGLPVVPSRLDLTSFSLEAIGFRASAFGDISFDAPPIGAMTVTLQNWRNTLDGLGQTLAASAPDFTNSAALATAWLEQYGVPGRAEDETQLEFEFRDDGQVLVNGQPFEG